MIQKTDEEGTKHLEIQTTTRIYLADLCDAYENYQEDRTRDSLLRRVRHKIFHRTQISHPRNFLSRNMLDPETIEAVLKLFPELEDN